MYPAETSFAGTTRWLAESVSRVISLPNISLGNGRTMEHVAQRIGEFAIRYRIRGDKVQRTTHAFLIEREQDGAHCVVNGDPTEPLLAISDPAAKAEAKRR